MMKNLSGSEILKFASVGVLSILLFSACGKSNFSENAQIAPTKLDFIPDTFQGENPIEDANTELDPSSDNKTPLPENPIPVPAPTPTPAPAPIVVNQPVEYVTITLETETRVRTLKDNVLEVVQTLKSGDVIRIEKNLAVVNYNFRNEEGQPQFSSTGFYPKVQILKAGVSDQELKTLNELSTGLFVTSIISSDALMKTEVSFKPLTSQSPGPGYQKFFEDNGRPKSIWTKKALERFPNLNKGVLYGTLSPADRKKWAAVMGELQRVADRSRRSPKDLLVIDHKLAMQYSLDFEQKGLVYGKGAWSVAVKATSIRYGFGEVPCAEFMSEVVRQAYARAGYNHNDDFSSAKKNTLSVANDAPRVFNFAAYLARAGWIPWDASVYIPAMGAIVMHNYGYSPGHTYMSAGSNGRFVIDNGSPEGRDLRAASEKTIRDMFQTGVFFLPPGFNPMKWQ